MANPVCRSTLDEPTVGQLIDLLAPLLTPNDLHLLGPALVVLTDLVRGNAKKAIDAEVTGSLTTLVLTPLTGAVLDALLILDRQGVLDCDIYLSGSHRCYKLPKSTTHDTVAELGAHGNVESIDATLKKAHADVVDADTVLIYTDGCLTDGNVKAGDWRSRGVDLIGVMTCADFEREHFRRKMEEHFHKAIMTDDGVTLASAICQYILMRP